MKMLFQVCRGVDEFSIFKGSCVLDMGLSGICSWSSTSTSAVVLLVIISNHTP